MKTDFSFLDSFSEEAQDRLKRSVLECSLLFHTDNNLVSSIKKDDIFSKSIFSIIVDAGGNPTAADIAELYRQRFGKPVDSKMLDQAIMGLVHNSFISPFNGGYRPHKKVADTIREGVASFEERMACLNKQLVEKAESLLKTSMSNATKDIVVRNIRKSLNLYFLLYALDYVYDDEAEHRVEETDIIDEVKRELSMEESDALMEAFSELIEKPTDEQKETLMLCVKLFVGAQFLQIDPLVSQMELAKLKEKRFILDTDFLLYSITKHCRQSSEYKKLLKTLRKIGCELVIPNEVVIEVLKHAQCAESNYHHFRSELEAVDEEIVDVKANNVFVKDFLMNCIRNGYKKSLHSYLYENYLSDTQALEFIKEYIESELHIRAGLDYEIPVDADYAYVLEQLTDKIYQKTLNSDKDRWRSNEETYSLSRVDALLLLNALALNKDVQPVSSKELLYANTYLVTFTTKSIKSAKELNIYRKVVTRPEILISLLTEIGVFDDKHDGMVNLFENPFLAQIMTEHWDVVSALAKTGVDLRGQSIPKLCRDLGATVHQFLTKRAEEENPVSDDNPTRFEAISSVEEFLKYVQAVKIHNYGFMPGAEVLIEKYKEQRNEIESEKKKSAKAQAYLDKKAKGFKAYLRRTGQLPEEHEKRCSLKEGKKK